MEAIAVIAIGITIVVVAVMVMFWCWVSDIEAKVDGVKYDLNDTDDALGREISRRKKREQKLAALYGGEKKASE